MSYKYYPNAIQAKDENNIINTSGATILPDNLIDDQVVSANKLWSGRKTNLEIHQKKFFQIVLNLPENPDSNTIYLTQVEDGFVAKIYDNNSWNCLGEIEV